MAPLQRRSLYQFVATLAGALVVVALVVFADAPIVLLVLILPIAFLADWLPKHLTRPRPDQPFITDERDRAIQSKVPKYQRFGIYLGILIWMMILASRADSRDQIALSTPVILLLPLCVVTVDYVFSLVGTMIEYWRTR
jgi:hypothetical protein